MSSSSLHNFNQFLNEFGVTDHLGNGSVVRKQPNAINDIVNDLDILSFGLESSEQPKENI
jgi:hypothetical protein